MKTPVARALSAALVLLLAASAVALGAGVGGGKLYKVPSAFNLPGFACPPAGACIAVGTRPNTKQHPGAGVIVPVSHGKPGQPQTFASIPFFSSVACPHKNFCIAVGQGTHSPGVVVPIANGKAGKPINVGGVYFGGIGCGSANSCWATGSDTHGTKALFAHITASGQVTLYTLNGAPPELFATGEGAPDVPICTSATSCLVGGTENLQKGPGAVTWISNGKVTAIHAVSGPTAVAGLACHGAKSCVAAGFSNGAGWVMSVKNGKPGKAHRVAGTSYLAAVACTSKTRCYAFGLNKSTPVAVPINRGKPGKAVKVPAQLNGVVCKRKSCVGAGTKGGFPNGYGVIYDF